MQFTNSYSEYGCAGCCPECAGTKLPHCTHCPQFRRAVAAPVPDGYDYSHLVGSPGKQTDEIFDAVRFDGLLTAYDRLLLKFGMHISWQLD
jgi:hypothetical protein